MKIKYQRTSTTTQHGNRFETDTTKYELTLFDQGISATIPFKVRTQVKKLVELADYDRMEEHVVAELHNVPNAMCPCFETSIARTIPMPPDTPVMSQTSPVIRQINTSYVN